MEEEQVGEGDADGVPEAWHEPDDGLPAETDAEEVEEAHVEAVGGFAYAGEAEAVVFGKVGGDLFADFFGFARAFGVGDQGEVGVLDCMVSSGG